jgi:hypothetical protein
MSDTANPARKVKTVPFRMSFPALLAVRVQEENGVKKESYQLNMLFPPGTDHEAHKAALRAAASDKWPDQTKRPKLKRGPNDVIRDFAEFNAASNKPLPGDWAGWTFIRANANVSHPPAVVGPVKGADGKFPVVKEPREVYGGRWARATLEAFAYDRKDGKGVTFGLLNVQLLKHDTKFGSGVSDPNKDFDNASEEWTGEASEDFGDKPKDDAAGDDGWN